MASKYGDINVKAFSSTSSWMNLGLWSHPGQRFEDANEALAREIIKHISLDSTTLIDVGCGRGESLALWASAEFSHFRRIIGVNSSHQEYEEAAKRFRHNSAVSVVLGDASGFFQRKFDAEKFSIVSVDAVYHFFPNRLEFLRACNASGALEIACSDILLSEKWSREKGRLDFMTSWFRSLFLRLVCAVAGIPSSNLEYGPQALAQKMKSNGWTCKHCVVVTDRVFYPFSQYCTKRSREFSWFSKEKWSLLSSGAFMRLLAWLQAVDFVIYAADRK